MIQRMKYGPVFAILPLWLIRWTSKAPFHSPQVSLHSPKLHLTIHFPLVYTRVVPAPEGRMAIVTYVKPEYGGRRSRRARQKELSLGRDLLSLVGGKSHRRVPPSLKEL